MYNFYLNVFSERNIDMRAHLQLHIVFTIAQYRLSKLVIKR